MNFNLPTVSDLDVAISGIVIDATGLSRFAKRLQYILGSNSDDLVMIQSLLLKTKSTRNQLVL